LLIDKRFSRGSFPTEGEAMENLLEELAMLEEG
jgi:hypothetical protein